MQLSKYRPSIVLRLALRFLLGRQALASSQSWLSEPDFLLLSSEVCPDPEIEVVLRTVATGIRVAVCVPDPDVAASRCA